MELTLKRLLESAEFKKYRGKGYDPAEVDDFLDKATAMAAKVEVQLTQALDQAKAASGGPSASPADIEAEVERRVAERLASQPAAASAEGEDEIAEQARRTLALAQRTADAAVKEAREEAEQIVSGAQAEAATARAEADAYAESTRADADAHATSARAEADALSASTRAEVDADAARERREARQRLAAEIGELEGARESLRTDVNILERHVEEQRSQLGSTLAELHQILDDPAGFRMAPVPALNDPTLPDFADLDQPEPEPEPEVAPEPAAEPEPEPEPVAEAEAEPEPEPEPEPVVDLVEVEVVEVVAIIDDESADEIVVIEESFARVPPPVDEPVEDHPVAPALQFDEVDHEAPGLFESGPPTAPVGTVDLGDDVDDDAFLAELRKAMSDDEPLGPRDDLPGPDPEALFGDDDRRGWRFGRRS